MGIIGCIDIVAIIYSCLIIIGISNGIDSDIRYIVILDYMVYYRVMVIG